MIIILQATNNDISAILQIRTNNLSVDIINQRLSDQTKGISDFLVLEADSQIVSFVVLRWTGKNTHPEYPDMVDLYTKTEERGKGYGTALIVECENRAKSRGYKKIGLAVNPNLNDHARKLYEKLGYVHDGGKSYIDGVYDGIDDWCVDLEKELK